MLWQQRQEKERAVKEAKEQVEHDTREREKVKVKVMKKAPECGI